MTHSDTAKDTTRRHKEMVKNLVDRIISSPNGEYRTIFAEASEAIQESLGRIIDRATGVFNQAYFANVRRRDYVFQNNGVPITYAIVRAGEHLLAVKDRLKQQGIVEIGLGAQGDLLVVISSARDGPLREIKGYPVALSTMDPPARTSFLHEDAVHSLVKQCGERACADYLAALPSRKA